MAVTVAPTLENTTVAQYHARYPTNNIQRIGIIYTAPGTTATPGSEPGFAIYEYDMTRNILVEDTTSPQA